MLSSLAVLLALASAAPIPREWRAFHLGMSRAEFLAAAQAMRGAGLPDPNQSPCTALAPASTSTSEARLFPRVALESAGAVAADYSRRWDNTRAAPRAQVAVFLRFFTPRAGAVEVCTGDADGTELEGRFLDGALAMLRVFISNLNPNDVLTLSTAKYGAPALAVFKSTWREPTPSGWKPHDADWEGYSWLDESTAIRLLRGPTDPEGWGSSGGTIGYATHLTLIDLGALKNVAAVPDDRLPDPKAEHEAELLKTKAF